MEINIGYDKLPDKYQSICVRCVNKLNDNKVFTLDRSRLCDKCKAELEAIDAASSEV